VRLLEPGSVFALVADHRDRPFPRRSCSDLFPSGRGKASIPGEVIASVIVLRALYGHSETGDEERGLCHAVEEAERHDHERPEADGGEDGSADEEGPAVVEVGQSPDEWPQYERRQCGPAEGQPRQGLAAADGPVTYKEQGER
jgi:hypothetical protein